MSKNWFGRTARAYRFSTKLFLFCLLEFVLWSVPDVCGDRCPHLAPFLVNHNALYHMVDKTAASANNQTEVARVEEQQQIFKMDEQVNLFTIYFTVTVVNVYCFTMFTN